MKRIVEILKEFAKNNEIVALNYLVNKFGLSERTILKDIASINRLFEYESNCYIKRWKNNLLLLGDEKNNFLLKMIKKFSSDFVFTNVSDFHSLIIYLAFTKNYLSSARISELVATNLYTLKRKIKGINQKIKNFSYNVTVDYRSKKGWYLAGDEKDIRFLSMNILDCQQKVPLYDEITRNLAGIKTKIEQMIKAKTFSSNYHYNQLISFLIVQIKRIERQKLISIFQLPDVLIKLAKAVEKDANSLLICFHDIFGLKLNISELNYLKMALLLTRNDLNLQQNCELYSVLKQEIKSLIIDQFCYPVMLDRFEIVLNQFLQLTLVKLVFGYFPLFTNFNLTRNDLFYQYCHGFELLKGVGLVFKRFNISGFDYICSNDYYLILFESVYLLNDDHKIPISIFIDTNEVKNVEINNLIKLLKLKYPNLTIKSQNINANNINLINFNNSNELNIIVSNNSLTATLKKEKGYLINLANNEIIGIIKNINNIIQQFALTQIKTSIITFSCFLDNYQFLAFKSTLFQIEAMLCKKYKFENLFLAHEENLIDTTYLKNNILVVKKIIAAKEPKLPIILIYFKNSLIYKNRYSINFLFYIINNNYDNSQYQLFTLFLNSLIKNKIEITDIKNLHTLLEKLSF